MILVGRSFGFDCLWSVGEKPLFCGNPQLAVPQRHVNCDLVKPSFWMRMLALICSSSTIGIGCRNLKVCVFCSGSSRNRCELLGKHMRDENMNSGRFILVLYTSYSVAAIEYPLHQNLWSWLIHAAQSRFQSRGPNIWLILFVLITRLKKSLYHYQNHPLRIFDCGEAPVPDRDILDSHWGSL